LFDYFYCYGYHFVAIIIFNISVKLHTATGEKVMAIFFGFPPNRIVEVSDLMPQFFHFFFDFGTK